jgi:hypothetical protein
MTVTATKIDSSHESSKNSITWAWLASTTIVYSNPVLKISLKHQVITQTVKTGVGANPLSVQKYIVIYS